jgi:molybdenum cofactor guanylyltransferase
VERFDPAVITAAILAGGAGARMGGNDKGLEALAGKPLIAHAIAALRGQTGAFLICANRNAERYAKFAQVCADATPGFHGPLAGICAALMACRTNWLLTVPVDCPRPPADLACRLRAHIGGAPAAVVHDGEYRQPLFALYRRELAAAAAAAVGLDTPVWRWHEQIGAIEVDFADQRDAFANLNTIDEFRRWEVKQRG